MARKSVLVEKIAETASDVAKKLYSKIAHLEGFKDVTDSENEKGSNGKWVWDFILQDNSHDVPTYIYVGTHDGNPNLFDVMLDNDNISLYKKTVYAVTEDKIIDLSDDLYDYGPETAFKNFGVKGEVIRGSTRGNKIESINSLKESLNPKTYDKINTLIKECLKEGLEVEVTIPKTKLNRNKK